MSGSLHPSAEKYAAHVNPALVKLLGTSGHGRVFVRAKGSTLWDDAGREYLDFSAASGSANLGHNHPHVLERMKELLATDTPNVGRGAVSGAAAELAEALARVAAPLSRVLFSTSGADAIDASIKLARAATKKKAIVHCKGGFHGRTLSALSLLGAARMRDPFEPLLPECYEVPFDDLRALARELDQRKAAAFVVEPLQAEAGVIVPHEDYLRAAQDLCKRAGALLVVDETQTGLGRTGMMFAHQNDRFVPDVLVVGTALGGGLVPVAATLTTVDIHDRAYGRIDRFDMHGSSLSTYALGCEAALATLATLENDDIVRHAKERGEQLRERLRDTLTGHPFVRGVRGRGLLVGVELGPHKSGGFLSRLLPGLVDMVSKQIFAQWLAVHLLERGIYCQPASLQRNVLKLEPPLTVTEAEVDRVVDAIADILGRYTDLRTLVSDVAARLGSQLVSGGAF